MSLLSVPGPMGGGGGGGGVGVVVINTNSFVVVIGGTDVAQLEKSVLSCGL